MTSISRAEAIASVQDVWDSAAMSFCTSAEERARSEAELRDVLEALGVTPTEHRIG